MKSGYLFLDGLRNVANRLARIIMSVHLFYELGYLTGGNAFTIHENNHLLQGIVRTGVRRQGLLFEIACSIPRDREIEFAVLGLESAFVITVSRIAGVVTVFGIFFVA